MEGHNMATAAEDLTQALKEVADGGKTDSQSVADSNPDVTQALKEVASRTSPAADSEVSVKGTDGVKTVPLDRFSEVVAQKNEALGRLKALEAQFNAVNERESGLKARVGQLETDHQILDAIKGLAADPRYKSTVTKIDKALQGIHEDTEVAEEKGDDKAVAKLEEAYQTKIAELEDLAAEQKSNQLWEASGKFARELLASLPPEYTDEDKAVISKLWTPLVDWNYIEEHGSDVIPAALQHALAGLIKDYGTPRGALVSNTKQEMMKNVPESVTKSNDDYRKEVEAKSWGEMKDGKFTASDADFSAAVGELLRRERA
jgi:hypothetical protein